MNVFTVLDSLQQAVSDSKPLPWPLQSKSVINKDKFMRLIERTRETLPEEVHQARWISRETRRIAQESTSQADRLVRDAHTRAREILRTAQEETERLIQGDEVVVRAREESERLLMEAHSQAEALRREAEEYADKLRSSAENTARETREEADRYALRVLGGMETELSKILSIVKQGRTTIVDSSEP